MHKLQIFRIAIAAAAVAVALLVAWCIVEDRPNSIRAGPWSEGSSSHVPISNLQNPSMGSPRQTVGSVPNSPEAPLVGEVEAGSDSSLQVLVVDGETEKRLPGKLVQLYHCLESTRRLVDLSVSDVQGQAILWCDHDSMDTGLLCISDPFGEYESIERLLGADRQVTCLLNRGPKHTIAVQVIGADSRSGIVGATISELSLVTNDQCSEQMVAQTDDQGYATLLYNMTEQRYIRASKEGLCGAAAIVGSNTHTLQLELARGARVDLLPGEAESARFLQQISYYRIHPPTPQPEAALVGQLGCERLSDRNSISWIDGAVVVDRLPVKCAFLLELYSDRNTMLLSVEVPELDNLQNLEVRVDPPQGVIAVTASPTEYYLAKAQLLTGSRTPTGQILSAPVSAGLAQFKGLQNGSWAVWLEAAQDAWSQPAASVEVTLSAEETYRNISLETPSAMISGIITDESGRALKGVFIRAESKEGLAGCSGWSNADGTFSLGPVASGVYDIAAGGSAWRAFGGNWESNAFAESGLLGWSGTQEVATSPGLYLEIKVPNGEVTLNVDDCSAGVAVLERASDDGVTSRMSSSDGFAWSYVTEGRAHFAGLPVGAYYFRVESLDGRHARGIAVVSPKSPSTRIDVVLATTFGSLLGQLRQYYRRTM